MFDEHQLHHIPNYSYTIPDKFTSRCITSIPGNTTDNLFAISTNSLKKTYNEIHLLQFLEENSKLVTKGIYTVSGIINRTFPHPSDEKILYLSTTESNGTNDIHKAVVGKIPSVSESQYSIPELKKKMEVVAEFNSELEIHSLVPMNNNNLLIGDARNIITYNLDKQMASGSIKLSEGEDSTKTELDPHHNNLVATIQQSSVLIHDLRENKVKYEIQDAHKLNILDFDFNPNKQYCLMTCAEDCLIKFWDIRKPNLSLKTIEDIPNSVESVKYNKFHDLLVISSSSDGSVNLHKVTSVSSAPVLSSSYVDKSGVPASKEEDALIKCYDEHEDSVYSVTWSAASAWIFASVSYRGSVIINIVPNEEKYKILL